MNATEKLGIGRFETSEELAKELESKNKKEIADRVREISRNQASAQSIELRNKLREELSWKEHREIREALAWTWVERVFDKDMTPKEKAIAEVWAVIPWAAWVTQKLWWIEKWWKSASDSFSTAWDLLKQWKFMAAIAVFFKWITWKFSLSEWNKKYGEENETQASKPDQVNENNPDIQYILWINALYALMWKEKKTTKSILQSPQIKISNFQKLKNESINKNWIAGRLWIKNFNDDDVFKEIQILLNSEEKIDKLLWNEFPNWKNEKLIDVIILLNKKWFLTIWKLQEKIDNINFSINPEENINQLFESLWENLSIDYKDWKVIYWDIENGDKLIWNISWILITNIVSSNQRVIKSTNSKELIETIWQEKEEDKEFLRKLMKFKDDIIPNLEKLLPSDKRSDIASFFSSEWKWLKLKELTELYIITWWNPNIEQIWWIKTTLVYLKFWNILFKDRSWLAWAFAWELHERIIKDDPLIPEEAKNFFGNILSVIWKSVWERFKWVMLDIWNYTDTSTKLIVWWIIWAYFLSKKIRYVVSWIWAAATTFLALKIFDELSKDSKAKARMEEHGIKNATDLWKILDETL